MRTTKVLYSYLLLNFGAQFWLLSHIYADTPPPKNKAVNGTASGTTLNPAILLIHQARKTESFMAA
jgi:hypothetical protein